MALGNLELSLMAFPQNWNATAQQLTVNLVMLPVGNPLLPLGASLGAPLGSGPQFAGTSVNLNAVLLQGLASLPDPTQPVAFTMPYVAAPPIGAVSLFNALLAKLPAGTTVTAGTPALPAATVRIKKSLPLSYTTAFPFERPRSDDVITGDGYGCALAAQAPPQFPVQGPPPKIIAWGQLLSYALRQPQLAMALGLIYQVTLNVPAAAVANGGWLYFAIDTSVATNPWVADTAVPDAVRSYAARIPALDSAAGRNLFAAALFPVLTPAGGSEFTQAQLEAEIYDDGFAQVVHCYQPASVDTATGDDTQIAPGAEAGVQIGWDDEQVTDWFNRQLDLLRLRLGGAAGTSPEAPLGVLGYRIDVQQAGGAGAWTSLCQVNGSLPFSGANASGAGSTPSGELWVSPVPVRPASADWVSPNASEAWLPLYFSQWRGTSIVVHDDTISQINPGTTALPSSALSGNLAGVPPLLYGNDYNFRVRFVDLSGCGPRASDLPVHAGLAPSGFCAFRRHLPPKSLEVETTPPPLPAAPAADGVLQYPSQSAVRTITKLSVRRPHIGYPEALFAGVSPATFTGAALAALLTEAKATGRALSVPDPDVDRFQVTVEARIPAHDTGAAGTLPGQLDGDKYRVIYSLIEHFPDGIDPNVTLSLNYVDANDIAAMAPPADDSAALPIPTGRDIRIRLQPLAAVRSNYYGTAVPPAGLISDFSVRAEAADESTLFPFSPETQLKAVFLQPGDNLPQLLAQSLALNVQGLTLSAPLGKRVAFAASGALRHTLAADGGALTFANEAELLDHWIVALVIDIARDWTWDGFADPALTIYRDLDPAPCGVLQLPRTVPPAALDQFQGAADRTTSRLIFFDAVNPSPAPGAFPAPLNPQYRVVASFEAAPALQRLYDTLILPITTRPAQTPRIVATGIAESPYQAAADYSSSAARERHLWVEFDQPIADTTDDAYFCRVLAYGPDPLLAARLLVNYELPVTAQLPAPIEPPLPVDPENIRSVFATQSSDTAGLDAMVPMVPAIPSGGQPDGVHFIVPLPQGVDAGALDLFGFWTYEFRVGHAVQWSTAQGRFGRPVRVTGIQHPAPQLTCAPNRSSSGIVVSAPYATTVLNGSRIYDLEFGDPQTVIWFMLYAQVMQADGASFRNILLAHQPGQLQPNPPPLLLQMTPVLQLQAAGAPGGAPAPAPVVAVGRSVNREPRAVTTFDQQSIEGLLRTVSLPLTSSLSVLAVELLPGPVHVATPAGVFSGAQVGAGAAGLAGAAGTTASQEDPLGAQLGLRRVLRTSPLTTVPAIC